MASVVGQGDRHQYVKLSFMHPQQFEALNSKPLSPPDPLKTMVGEDDFANDSLGSFQSIQETCGIHFIAEIFQIVPNSAKQKNRQFPPLPYRKKIDTQPRDREGVESVDIHSPPATSETSSAATISAPYTCGNIIVDIIVDTWIPR